MTMFRQAIHSLQSSSSSASSLPLQISIGILAASYWRGSWYVLDHILYPNERLKSGLASLVSGSSLLALQQYILSPSYNGTKTLVRLLPPPDASSSIMSRRRYIKANRFVLLYGIATSCVLLWRGTWLLWDEAAHSIADFMDDCNGNSSSSSSNGSGRGEESSTASALKLTRTPDVVPKTNGNGADATTTTNTTTTATTAATALVQTSQQSHSTTSINEAATNTTSSIPSSSSAKEQHPPPTQQHSSENHPSHSQQPSSQPQQPPPPPPQQHLPHLPHPHHEDHHGESSVTQHEDLTDRTLFYSGIASHIFATVVLLSMGRFVTVMAPPANSTLLKDAFIHERGKNFAKAARKFMSNPQ
ncbi:hypothetical protein ACHAWU_009499 [Discostella pseudostelligera]|uniref:Uncharacterized protein n=1 Tax=Discostella pseudostelligera TaxID=259834 RepID=A0ABD3M0X2_9STRA